MTESKKTGMARVAELHEDRTLRAKELKKEGKKVFGYLCIYPPLEMMTALDIVPFRILGDINEPITEADKALPTQVCPFLRSCLDLGMKDKYDFLDGVVFSHSCDVAEKTAHIWHIYLKPAYFHFIDTPHTEHKAAIKQNKDLLLDFKNTLEQYAGEKITDAKLASAIKLHDEQRELVTELYDLKKPDPPLVSGAETIQIIVAVMSLPAAEGNQLLKEVISEVKERRDGPKKQPVRLLNWGSILDNTSVIEMIEDVGANVVIDDTCVGSRAYFPKLSVTPDPFDGLAKRYLVDIKCPRTFRQKELGPDFKKDYIADLEDRFGYLREYAKDWNVSGVILQSVRYCDIHGYDVPGLKDYFDHLGLPNIYLEHDYSLPSLAQLRTRVQAFLEVIG
ncbi:2-hydroxyacyl-CoA dehydratase subunit D [Chloroflexota bacterium]